MPNSVKYDSADTFNIDEDFGTPTPLEDFISLVEKGDFLQYGKQLVSMDISCWKVVAIDDYHQCVGSSYGLLRLR
ncbi:hypothetical protein CEXT_213531 [Caerostris extrusa]|uniref:Uncharacterized protein n=1 Tax=Caerostris extrusa TaxID=172846 RepID=A0AAV4MCJ7_CAEEX|nr:hypothetical protein CEXT_213531 [Caerostris extrusa]